MKLKPLIKIKIMKLRLEWFILKDIILKLFGKRCMEFLILSELTKAGGSLPKEELFKWVSERMNKKE